MKTDSAATVAQMLTELMRRSSVLMLLDTVRDWGLKLRSGSGCVLFELRSVGATRSIHWTFAFAPTDRCLKVRGCVGRSTRLAILRRLAHARTPHRLSIRFDSSRIIRSLIAKHSFTLAACSID